MVEHCIFFSPITVTSTSSGYSGYVDEPGRTAELLTTYCTRRHPDGLIAD